MKLTILNLIRSVLHRAQEAEKKALMAAAISEERYKIWHKHNPGDGQCPYNPVGRIEEANEATDKLQHLEQIYQFALETFIDE